MKKIRIETARSTSRTGRMRGGAFLLAICVNIGAVAAIPAVQSQSVEEPAEEAESGAPGFDRVVLEPVLVTARRREESLQDISVSITAVSQDELDQNNINSLTELQYLVPSMSVTGGNTGRSHPRVSLRGVNGRVTDGQAVVTYLNEVALPAGNQNETGGGTGLLYDLENVQVLKGPQGTLFGRNAIGGAILYQTKRPTNNWEGYIEGGVGNYSAREIKAAVNAPLIDDRLLVRVAVNGANRDGFTRSLGTANHPNGVDLDDRNYIAGRLTTTFRPVDNVQNVLIVDYVEDDTHGTSQILTRINPNAFAALLFPGVLDSLAAQQALGVRTQLPTNTFSGGELRFWSVTDIFEWEVNDSLKFRNIAGATKLKTQFFGDWDGSEFPIVSSSVGGFGPPLETPYRLKIYSEEAQLLGNSFGGDVTWIIGGLFLHTPPQPDPNGSFLTQILGTLGDGAGQRRQKNTNWAIYGQGTYDLSSWIDGLSFTGGYRYSRDKIELQEGNFEKAAFSASSWTLGVDYKLTDDTLLYIASRRGYHAGGVNDIQSAEPVPYDPEFVTDVELGIKSIWTIGDATLRTNIALYRSDYTDFQFEQVALIGTEIETLFRNAGEARVQGAEFEGHFYPIENLEFTAQYAYLDFDYTRFDPGVDEPYLQATILGNGPVHRYSVGSRWDLTRGASFGDFGIWARWNWQSETMLRFAIQSQPSYGLLNLGVDWKNVGGFPVDASFSMTNAADKTYAIGGFSFIEGPGAALGSETTVYGEPRMYMFNLRYRFGGN